MRISVSLVVVLALLGIVPMMAAPAAAAGGEAGAVLVVGRGAPHHLTAGEAEREGLLAVDLSDDWAPFLFSESDGPGSGTLPNDYRETFIALADDRTTPDGILLESPEGRAAVLSTVPAALRSMPGEPLSPAEERALRRARSQMERRRSPSFLEVYGIPPTLGVLASRMAADEARSCHDPADVAALRALEEPVVYESHERARRDHERTLEEASWLDEPAGPEPRREARQLSDDFPEAATVTDAGSPAGIAADRLARARRARARLDAIRAAQRRLACEGLLTARHTEGSFDLATHLALAAFEKKNEIFGWGLLSGRTLAALERPPGALHLETFRRILAERVADAAGIVEDGTADADWRDASGAVRPVPDLIGDHVEALVAALGIETPEDLAALLRTADTESLRVAFPPPPLPEYYAAEMDLAVEIDRGDVWYDFPYDEAGEPLAQPRRRFPHLTLRVRWNGQEIPLVRWRTTIGSWRSERHTDGQGYLRYKSSDVGPRIWRHVVAAPVWVPPGSTPARELLTRKVLDVRHGPVRLVDTGLMGPGFASAYGLVMAIHLEMLPEGGARDNLIRTHGSVDYTSIARRYSHGCHRLVNDRALRMFGFILRHRSFLRLGQRALGLRRSLVADGEVHRYSLPTRGYYYELVPPLPVNVTPGRILGTARAPLRGYFPKPGTEYAPAAAGMPAPEEVESP